MNPKATYRICTIPDDAVISIGWGNMMTIDKVILSGKLNGSNLNLTDFYSEKDIIQMIKSESSGEVKKKILSLVSYPSKLLQSLVDNRNEIFLPLIFIFLKMKLSN